MLKKIISAVLTAVIVSVMSISVFADTVEVGNPTVVSPGDKLSTGSNQYKTVLITDSSVDDLSSIEAKNIYYIDQAENDIQAFANMGLKGGAQIAEGTYKMYLVNEAGEKTVQDIYVSKDPVVEGEGQEFTEVEVDGVSAVYQNAEGENVVDKGYKVDYTPAGNVSFYKLYITYTPQEGNSITYPKDINISGSGNVSLGLQINGIPCDEDGDITGHDFTVTLVPVYAK